MSDPQYDCSLQLVIDLGGIHVSENGRLDLTPMKLDVGATFIVVRVCQRSFAAHECCSCVLWQAVDKEIAARLSAA